jgi:hypothetical protein
VILLLGIYSKKSKTGYSRDNCSPMFITALFTITKLWKEPRCPTTDEWIKKLWYIYTMWFDGKWMELQNIKLSEVS